MMSTPGASLQSWLELATGRHANERKPRAVSGSRRRRRFALVAAVAQGPIALIQNRHIPEISWAPLQTPCRVAVKTPIEPSSPLPPTPRPSFCDTNRLYFS